ncbi:NUDIX hydrolase [Streptacidiphilus sp. PB12-B1b]|uniref:NUDIX hydrolase n=1 Tax=Streptacidiphilus sp. PB12-B1b TaxID=2705012 RepID=UPI0015F999B7|nr:NUDIX hydrolase [Streptacidiphilus sp. PB12-B1b]QMU74649.1 NUDIX hydrolase [Streptacidiphilus sp. PB12-B1b]
MGDQRVEARTRPVPPAWVERLRGLANGEYTPVQPRLAATVVLLREHDGGPQAYLLRRRASMAFAGGMYAYPGGGVDPRDGAAPGDGGAVGEAGWAGPSPQEWARRLGCPPETARAVVCAAVRETFEESGVLLAGPDAHSVVADVSGAEWRAARAALEAHELSFAEFLAGRGLVLRSDLLGAWARWITPEFEERRYDTWFFVAVLPQGQRTAEVPGEADRVVWLAPAEAVKRADSGEFLMLPPTLTTLRELLPYGTPAEALAAAGARTVSPILARARITDDGEVSVSWPGHPELTMASPGTEDAGSGRPGPIEPGPDVPGTDEAGAGAGR